MSLRGLWLSANRLAFKQWRSQRLGWNSCLINKLRKQSTRITLTRLPWFPPSVTDLGQCNQATCNRTSYSVFIASERGSVAWIPWYQSENLSFRIYSHVLIYVITITPIWRLSHGALKRKTSRYSTHGINVRKTYFGVISWSSHPGYSLTAFRLWYIICITKLGRLFCFLLHYEHLRLNKNVYLAPALCSTRRCKESYDTALAYVW